MRLIINHNGRDYAVYCVVKVEIRYGTKTQSVSIHIIYTVYIPQSYYTYYNNLYCTLDDFVIAEDMIKATGNREVVVIELDTSDLQSVRRFAREVLHTESNIHILVCSLLLMSNGGAFFHTYGFKWYKIKCSIVNMM